MSGEVWVAIISGVFTLVGVIVTVYFGNSKTIYRIDQLEKKVSKHNNLVERMYAVETRVDVAEERIKVANHRLKDLEREQ